MPGPGRYTPDLSARRVLLFSRSGFTPDLHAQASNRRDVELIGLDRLYHGD